MFSYYATHKISPICKISNFSEDLSFLNLRSHLKTHLSDDLTEISKWFIENVTIANLDKCHYIFLVKDNRGGTILFSKEGEARPKVEILIVNILIFEISALLPKN